MISSLTLIVDSAAMAGLVQAPLIVHAGGYHEREHDKLVASRLPSSARSTFGLCITILRANAKAGNGRISQRVVDLLIGRRPRG